MQLDLIRGKRMEKIAADAMTGVSRAPSCRAACWAVAGCCWQPARAPQPQGPHRADRAARPSW